MKKGITMDRLDPARTALVVVHMVKGVAGEVDTPFNRLFRQRAEKTGVIGVQLRLLDGVPQGEGEGGLHGGHIPARAAWGQSELPVVAHPLRMCLPDGGDSSGRADGRPRPPAR